MPGLKLLDFTKVSNSDPSKIILFFSLLRYYFTSHLTISERHFRLKIYEITKESENEKHLTLPYSLVMGAVNFIFFQKN